MFLSWVAYCLPLWRSARQWHHCRARLRGVASVRIPSESLGALAQPSARAGLPGRCGTWPRRVAGPGRGRQREAPAAHLRYQPARADRHLRREPPPGGGGTIADKMLTGGSLRWRGWRCPTRDPRWGLRQMRAPLGGRDAVWVTYSAPAPETPRPTAELEDGRQHDGGPSHPLMARLEER